MNMTPKPEPFPNCPALDGYHCQTNSLAKIFHYHGHPLSEDMLLGLGAGMGFMYWKMKFGEEDYIFVGGRANTKSFFEDIGSRTGVVITEKKTTSARKARDWLLEKMAAREPAMMFGDMGYMPWFDLPEDYHFGGHTFTACGWDGKETVLISDMDQGASGLKEGFYSPVSLEDLEKLRGSPHKPFPPKNAYLEFDFDDFHSPAISDLTDAISETVENQLSPPISNFGIPGLRKTAKEVLKWPDIFDDHTLRMNLFNFYIFIEIGGTGGGCFRYMYARFLKEAAEIMQIPELNAIAKDIRRSGELLSQIAYLFEDAEHMTSIPENVAKASELFSKTANIEEGAFQRLAELV